MDPSEAAKKRDTIRVFWLDRGHFAAPEFGSLACALAYAQSEHASASFHQGATVLASWDAAGGYKVYCQSAAASAYFAVMVVSAP